MKRLTRLLVSTSVATCVLAGCGTNPVSGADDEAATIAKAVAANWEIAVASRDAAGIANLFAADGVFQNPAGIFKGRAAIARYREAGIKSGVVKEEVTVTDAHRIGDVIYDMGDFTVFVASSTGTKQIGGRFAGVLSKSGGKWRIDALTGFAVPPLKQESSR